MTENKGRFTRIGGSVPGISENPDLTGYEPELKKSEGRKGKNQFWEEFTGNRRLAKKSEKNKAKKKI